MYTDADIAVLSKALNALQCTRRAEEAERKLREVRGVVANPPDTYLEMLRILRRIVL